MAKEPRSYPLIIELMKQHTMCIHRMIYHQWIALIRAMKLVTSPSMSMTKRLLTLASFLQ